MRPSLSRWLLWLLVACLFLALVAGQSWATYYLFTSRFPGGNDFYSRWANGCALIWTGENPYSDEVTLRTQIGMYGRPARIGEDLAAYSYPLYALFFFWPLCFIHTYPLVQAIWMTLMLYALLAGVVLTARVARWRPPSWLWGATLVWAVFNYPHARALILGQMATLVFLALAAAMWALGRERDVLAGALLAVTTIKPQMSFLLVPWVLWWVAWRRRWGVWKGFGLAMALLVGISFLLVPTWLGDFLEALRYYDVVSATDYHSLTWVMVRYFLGLGPVVEAVGVAAFALYGLLEAWRGRRAGWCGFLWTTGLLLILTHFIAPRTATTHYTMLLLPLFSWFALLGKRLGRRVGLVVVGIEVALLVGQWAIFLTTIQGNYETAPVYLPFPLLMLAVQILSRRCAWLADG
ncbi:MAG: DUF2029 domain-containing protein [Anaerolineae bacterium]|nr:DUF2029 domain-containing protein [Anaerolineae bacterium]